MAEEKAIVMLSNDVYRKIRWFTENYENEIGAVGTVSIRQQEKEKYFYVEKLFFPQQAVTGSTVEFNEVLFLKKGTKQFEVGTPYVDGAIVKANVIKQTKDAKKIIFKFGRRKKLRTKKGHRQPITVIRIESI